MILPSFDFESNYFDFKTYTMVGSISMLCILDELKQEQISREAQIIFTGINMLF